MTTKWNGTAWRIAPLPTMRMVGAGPEEPDEAEEPEEAEKDNSPDAMMERVATQPDYERQATFEYLKEFRRRKKLNPYVGRQEQARVGMRAEMYSLLQEDAERSHREITNGGTMATDGSNVVSCVEDGNGKLVKRRAAARKRIRKDENGPKSFTQEDQERINRTCDHRHTRAWYQRQLLAIAEGKVIVSKEQCQALLAFGRTRGYQRVPQ